MATNIWHHVADRDANIQNTIFGAWPESTRQLQNLCGVQYRASEATLFDWPGSLPKIQGLHAPRRSRGQKLTEEQGEGQPRQAASAAWSSEECLLCLKPQPEHGMMSHKNHDTTLENLPSILHQRLLGHAHCHSRMCPADAFLARGVFPSHFSRSLGGTPRNPHREKREKALKAQLLMRHSDAVQNLSLESPVGMCQHWRGGKDCPWASWSQSSPSSISNGHWCECLLSGTTAGVLHAKNCAPSPSWDHHWRLCTTISKKNNLHLHFCRRPTGFRVRGVLSLFDY